MWDVFTKVGDFFFELFSGDAESIRRRKELRLVHETLSSARYKVFNKGQMSVTAVFGQGYFLLYQYLTPIHEIFHKTLHNSEKKIRDLFFSYLMDHQFVGDVFERKKAFLYEQIRPRLEAQGQLEGEVKKINQEFEGLMEDLKRQNRSQINNEMRELMALDSLATHNYAPLFKKLGFPLEKIGKEKPRFSPAQGEDILPDLQDLYYILAKVHISPLLEKGLFLLLERMNPAQAGENQKKIQKILMQIQTLFHNQCSHHLLLNLIQAIKEDPFFRPETMEKDEDYVGEYIKDFHERFIRDRDRAVREITEGVLGQDIAKLFGGAELLPLAHYNEEFSRELMKANLPGFKHIKGFVLLKSFAQSIMANEFLPPMKEILVDGFFQNKDFGHKLGQYYYASEQIKARVDAFDGKIADGGKSSVESLKKYLDPRNQSGSGMTVASRMVENIDKYAQGILEDEVRAIYQFAKYTEEILKDYKNPNPQNVNNIKGLGGNRNKEIMSGLYDAYQKTTLFLKIMKNFVVLIPSKEIPSP